MCLFKGMTICYDNNASHFVYSYDLKPKPLCKIVVNFNLHTSYKFFEHDAHKNNNW
jgi:hypothetical protein